MSLSLLLGLPALLAGRAEPDLTQLLPVQETRKIPPPRTPTASLLVPRTSSGTPTLHRL